MPELTITEVEVAKELPDWKPKGSDQVKGAKVYRYTVEGDERRPEDFVVNGSQPKKVGDAIEIEDGDFGPKVKKAGSRKGGGTKEFGWQTHPIDAKRMSRAHSQEMALQREANLIAAGNPPLQGDQLRHLIDWFENDTAGKPNRGVEIDGTTSDVPADTSDLFDPKAA